ncbi:rhodanese-like domain-containing protein [Geoalkalibacter halelectricus]|uniref:rhodanese-like domain-containing protein n=1 Tax=Geoalkalibacter halelectricus TaxID=2847045 RepID=UPI003D1DF201
MSAFELFQALTYWAPTKVQEWLLERHPEDFQLLDVRQETEYAQGHLPGAISTPLWNLGTRLRQLNPDLPTLVYCRFGLRSRAAAALLHGAGFKQVAILEGGYAAWKGSVAKGLDRQAFAVLDTSSVENLIAAAWLLEEGTRKFYARFAAFYEDVKMVYLFGQLAQAEEQHKKTLAELYALFSSAPGGIEVAAEGVSAKLGGEIFVEGGVALDSVWRWAKGRNSLEVIDLAVALETNAYDRYLSLQRKLVDEDQRRIVEILAGDERRHLKRLLEAYGRLC